MCILLAPRAWTSSHLTHYRQSSEEVEVSSSSWAFFLLIFLKEWNSVTHLPPSRNRKCSHKAMNYLWVLPQPKPSWPVMSQCNTAIRRRGWFSGAKWGDVPPICGVPMPTSTAPLGAQLPSWARSVASHTNLHLVTLVTDLRPARVVCTTHINSSHSIMMTVQQQIQRGEQAYICPVWASAESLSPPSGFWRTPSRPCSPFPLLLPVVRPPAAWNAVKNPEKQWWAAGRLILGGVKKGRPGEPILVGSHPFFPPSLAGQCHTAMDGGGEVAVLLAVPLHHRAQPMDCEFPVDRETSHKEKKTEQLEIRLSSLHSFKKNNDNNNKKTFLCIREQQNKGRRKQVFKLALIWLRQNTQRVLSTKRRRSKRHEGPLGNSADVAL